MGMNSATGSIYSVDPWVARHHYIIQNQHSILPCSLRHTLLPSFPRSTHCVWFHKHSCQVFKHTSTLDGSSSQGISSYRAICILYCSSQNQPFRMISLWCIVRWHEVLMMCCLHSSFTVPPHCNWVNLEAHSVASIEHVWRCTWRP